MHLQPPTTTTTTNNNNTCRITFSTPFILLTTIIFSLLLILSLSFSSPTPPQPHPSLFPTFHNYPNDQNTPSIAYLISGSSKDSSRILRLLFSVYHPRNQYLVHLDRKATPRERDDLARAVQSVPVFKAAQNVNVVGKADFRSKKLKPIVVDPGLYLAEESEVYYATQKRELPDAYRLFTGSSSAILSRKFTEFCILGSDNLPRTLLMYLSNSPSSESVYFPTILCNSQKFNGTTINHNMHYASFNSKSQARRLNSSDFNDLVMSGAAFASPFKADDPVLDQIDHELLHRNRDEPVPGGWCLGDTETNKCSVWGDAEIIRPGSGAKRLEKHFLELFTNGSYLSDQCQYEKSSSR